MSKLSNIPRPAGRGTARERLEQPGPQTYLVAGGGGGMRSTIILRILAQELSARGLPFTPIDGVQGQGGAQAIRHPTLQVQDIEANVGRLHERTPLLVIAHCVGTVAALEVVERLSDTRPAALVSIAPPLPSPRHTIETPQSMKKRSDGGTRMRVVDLPDGALDYSNMTESAAKIDPQYFVDMYAADDLEARLRRMVEGRNATVFAPALDWNVASPARVRAWHKEWDAALPAGDAADLRSRAVVVADSTHGLYVSPRSGLTVTAEEDIAFQRANANAVIDAGLLLLNRPATLVL
ncbi:MAG TPA: hypothetical protein VIR03_01905 [Candidatus Saccharimonadales bacterium]